MGKTDPQKQKEARFFGHIGPSMNPTICKDDLLEILPYKSSTPRRGDVVIFNVPAGNGMVVHRIVAIRPDGYVTRGDNCSRLDEWLVSRKDICGQVVAAHRGNRRRLITNGFRGYLAGKTGHARRRAAGLFLKLLRPAYIILSQTGLLRRLIPVNINPRVAAFNLYSTVFYQLLLGKKVIGFYDAPRLKWQIRRPYRLLVDEQKLPLP